MYSILENQKSNPCLYHQLTPKEVRIYNEVKTIFLVSGAGKTGQVQGKK